MPNDTIPLPEPDITSTQVDSVMRVYTVRSHSADQMHAHAAAVSAAKDERIKVLEDALQRYVNYDLLTGTRGKMNEIARAALGDKT